MAATSTRAATSRAPCSSISTASSARRTGRADTPRPAPSSLPGRWAANLHGGKFKPKAELRAQFKKLGVGTKTEVILYCGSGLTACHDALALELAGIPWRRVRLYEGSWSDWARDPFRPAAVGAEPG